MRGPRTLRYRANDTPIQPINEATARTAQVPAPSGGWNARGNLINMPPLDAITMDNVFPGVQEVVLRKGSVDWKTGFAANIKSLLPYTGTTTSKLFAATDAAIYDATSSGAVGASVATCTEGDWYSLNFITPGASYLVAANGVDNIKLYDGATWVTVTGVSVPAITGIATTSLTYPLSHKRRLWFIEINSMNVWYLPVESVGGAATSFPLGTLFKKGGSLLAMGSWTIDGGSGQDDLFVVVTTMGEIAVYQGIDPASSTTWALVGVYDAGIPVGDRPLLDFGGDLLYLSRNGLFPLSKLLQSTIIDRSTAFSFKIDGAFLDAAETYGSIDGWSMTAYRSANFLVVNIPLQEDVISYQFVMNTITGAWCRFTGWNARCWALFGTDLYFAGGTKVSKAWQGTSDAGVAITGTVAQAYNSLGFNSQKNISLVRPNIAVAGSATLIMAIDDDFKVFDGQTQVTFASLSTAAIWDSSLWDTGIWDIGLTAVEPKWLTVPSNPGYLHSFRLQLTTSIASFSWTSTNYAFRPAGIL
jgi:hypothetical protein